MAATRAAALGVMVLLSAAPGGGQSRPSAPRVVHIVAERFSFYPSQITVERGESIELRITSDDTSHGFRLLGPGEVDVEIPKRGRGDVRVNFEASEAGTFTFECSRVCGAGHAFMRGTIRVREP
jgi:cytochrome c oxidase subunit 2